MNIQNAKDNAALLGAIGGQGTNETGIVGAIQSFHGDNTNLLGQLLNKLGTNTGYTGVLTNGTTAGANAESATADVREDMDSLGDVGANAPGDDPSGGTPITIPLSTGYEMEMSLMPGEWAEVWGFGKRLVGWLLVAAYLLSIAKGTYDMVKAMGTMTQMRLPNMEGSFVGIGGNWGATLYPVLVAAIAVIWGVFLGAVGTFVTSGSNLYSTFTTSPVAATGSSAVNNGISYLGNAIPFALVFGLAGARLTWEVTKTKAMLIAQWAMRLIPG